MASKNSLAGLPALGRRLALIVAFISVATTAVGCMKNAFPTTLSPKPCPGDPCGMMACPNGFVCQLDSQCTARCQVQPMSNGNRLF